MVNSACSQRRVPLYFMLTKTEIVKAFARKRIEDNMTFARLAKDSGLSINTVYAICTAVQYPNDRTTNKILQYLGLGIAEILPSEAKWKKCKRKK